MRATIQGGIRPNVGPFATRAVVGRAVLRFAKKAMTRRQDPFMSFVDAFDRFMGMEGLREDRA